MHNDNVVEAAVRELQRALALVDLVNSPKRGDSRRDLELLLLKLREIKIKMYQEPGHKTPHVHIDYGRTPHVASFSIVPVRRLAGNLDKMYERAISDWLEINSELLLQIWQAVQSSECHELLVASLRGP